MTCRSLLDIDREMMAYHKKNWGNKMRQKQSRDDKDIRELLSMPKMKIRRYRNVCKA